MCVEEVLFTVCNHIGKRPKKKCHQARSTACLAPLLVLLLWPSSSPPAKPCTRVHRHTGDAPLRDVEGWCDPACRAEFGHLPFRRFGGKTPQQYLHDQEERRKRIEYITRRREMGQPVPGESDSRTGVNLEEGRYIRRVAYDFPESRERREREKREREEREGEGEKARQAQEASQAQEATRSRPPRPPQPLHDQRRPGIRLDFAPQRSKDAHPRVPTSAPPGETAFEATNRGDEATGKSKTSRGARTTKGKSYPMDAPKSKLPSRPQPPRSLRSKRGRPNLRISTKTDTDTDHTDPDYSGSYPIPMSASCRLPALSPTQSTKSSTSKLSKNGESVKGGLRSAVDFLREKKAEHDIKKELRDREARGSFACVTARAIERGEIPI